MSKYAETSQYIGEGPEEEPSWLMFCDEDRFVVVDEGEVWADGEYTSTDDYLTEDLFMTVDEEESMDHIEGHMYPQKDPTRGVAKDWIVDNLEEAQGIIAQQLDLMADSYGQGQASRYMRILATEAHKLIWMLNGVEKAINELDEIPGW